MYIKYGSFQFEDWEATLQNVVVQTRYSQRQFKTTKFVQMWVEGTVVATDQYNVSTRLAQIEAALADDGNDFGLYHDNGSPTQHYLQSNHPNNVTGNQIFMRQFPVDDGAEYVNGRNFRFGVKAEIADYETSLLEYRDSYKAIGDCGPIYQWSATDQGVMVRRAAPASVQTVIHSGYAKTTVPWFAPPPPYYGAPFHLSHLREIEYIGPDDRYPQGLSGYVTNWKYIYNLPTDTYNTPTVR